MNQSIDRRSQVRHTSHERGLLSLRDSISTDNWIAFAVHLVHEPGTDLDAESNVWPLQPPFSETFRGRCCCEPNPISNIRICRKSFGTGYGIVEIVDIVSSVETSAANRVRIDMPLEGGCVLHRSIIKEGFVREQFLEARCNGTEYHL